MTATTLTHPAATAPTTVLTRAQALDVILTVFRAHDLPAPRQISVWQHYLGVTVKLPDNERGQVDAWMAALEIPLAPALRVDSIVFAGEDRAFFTYGMDEYADRVSSPLLPGISLTIECFVAAAHDPHVHGDGLTLPPAGGAR